MSEYSTVDLEPIPVIHPIPCAFITDCFCGKMECWLHGLHNLGCLCGSAALSCDLICFPTNTNDVTSLCLIRFSVAWPAHRAIFVTSL